MKRLLKSYGNDVCLLVANYKTTRHAVQVFFVVVKNNVDYEVVDAFACQGRGTENIMSH